MEELNDFEEIINCHSIAKQENISFTDIILSMFELNRNPIKYGIFESQTTKKFWKNLLDNKYIGNIFENYSDDTIRKYWSVIKKCKSLKKYIIILNNYKELINNSGKTLLFLIDTIAEFVNLDLEITEFSAYLNMKMNTIKTKVLSESQPKIENESQPKVEKQAQEQEDFIIENKCSQEDGAIPTRAKLQSTVEETINIEKDIKNEKKNEEDNNVKEKNMDDDKKKNIQTLILCEKIFMKFKDRLFSPQNIKKFNLLMKKRKKKKEFQDEL